MFLLVPAYPGCPGSKAVKRLLLLLLYVQVELALLRPPIIFDKLRMPKIDCLTGKQQSSVCL